MTLTPGVRNLLVVLVVFYLFFGLASRTDWGLVLFDALTLNPPDLWEQGYFWQPLTYALLHDLHSPFHLIFNGMLFFFVAPSLEERWGSKRFWVFVVATALGGSLFVSLAWWLGLSASPVLGFSSVCLGFLVAWGITYPKRELYFFGVLPINGRYLIWITLGFEVLYAVGANNISSAAHFGGMAAAAILTLGLWRPTKLRRVLSTH